MELKFNDVDASTKELEATFTYDEIKKDIELEVQKNSKKIQIAGFRKGKVPAALLKKMFGDALEHEASEKVAGNKFWNIAEENKIRPLGTPKITDINYVPGESFSFKIKYEVIPEIDVKDYTGNEIEVFDVKVKDEDIEQEIKHILKSNEILEDVNAVTNDSSCIIDVELTRVDDSGIQVEGTKPEVIKIDLSNKAVHPEIIENSKGKKVGEIFSFNFDDVRTVKNESGEEEKVTDHYSYTAVIKGIKKSIVPELNEELIKKVTKDKVSTEEDLRKEIRHDIEHYFNHQVEDMLRNKLITMLVTKNDFTPPDTLVHSFLDDMLKREEESQKKQGYRKYDKEEAHKRLHKSAENEVKYYLLREALMKKENIKVGEEELTKMAEEEAAKTGLPVEKLLNYYKSSNYADRLSENKLFDFLKEHNTIKKVELSNNKKEEEVNE